jgi:hypothetical protein
MKYFMMTKYSLHIMSLTLQMFILRLLASAKCFISFEHMHSKFVKILYEYQNTQNFMLLHFMLLQVQFRKMCLQSWRHNTLKKDAKTKQSKLAEIFAYHFFCRLLIFNYPLLHSSLSNSPSWVNKSFFHTRI